MITNNYSLQNGGIMRFLQLNLFKTKLTKVLVILQLLLLVSFITVNIQASDLLIEIDFSIDEDGFQYVQENQTNYWMFGNHNDHNGNCLYITDDGVSNAYDIKSYSVSHVYKEINFNGTNAVTLTFDWLADGESCCDFLYVYLVPENFSITAGGLINSQYRLASYNGAQTIQNAEIPIGSNIITEDNMKLVFSWKNDGSVGTMPPASISNIKLEARSLYSETNVETFNVSGQLEAAEIDEENHTISLNIYNQDITDLRPTVSGPNFSSISPLSGESQDFTSPVVYTVTAEDGSSQDWTVSITNIAPSYSVLPFESDFTTGIGNFVLSQANQTNYWMHGFLDSHSGNCMYVTNNGSDNAYEAVTSYSHMFKGFDLTDIDALTLNFDWQCEAYYQYLKVYLVPDDVVISGGQQISSNYLLYTLRSSEELKTEEILIGSDKLTSDHMNLVFTWYNTSYNYNSRRPASISNIKLESRSLSSENSVETFSVSGQLEAAEIDKENHTVSLSVYNQDITDLSPTVSGSNFSSIAPLSGESQDFTSPVVYTVTAEDGTTQEWTISITNVAPNYAILPFVSDFTTNEGDFVLSQANQTNYWMHGSLDSHSGNCMYVTNNGSDNAYDAVTSYSHMFKAVDLTDIDALTLNFDWQCEAYYQYLKVYLVPDDVVILGGQQISSNYLLTTLRSNTELETEEILIGSDRLSANNMNLVFTWCNTSYNYYSKSPVSISNIELVERDLSTENEVESFIVTGQINATEIDVENHTVSIDVYNSEIINISPSISVSVFASISPATNEAQDFTSPVVYTVTAEDGSTQEWTVSVANLAPNYVVLPYESNFELDNDGFITFNQGQENYWMYGHLDAYGGNSMYITNNGVDNIYDITKSSISHVFKEIDFTDIPAATLSFDWLANGESCCDYLKVYLVPSDVSISAGSLINSDYLLGTYKGANEVQNVESNIFAGSILSDQMRLVFTWRNDGSVGSMPPASISNIKVEERIPSAEKEISLFTAPNQLSATEIDNDNNTISINLYDIDITNVTPNITISNYASVSPAMGEAQDFTSPVVYTVTAEDGSTQDWTVSITNVTPNYVSLPLESNFESGFDGFIPFHQGQENYWMHGTLDSYSGKSIYITNNGVDNTYNNVTSVSHIFKEVNFDQVNSAILSFDWIAGGKSTFHVLNVFLVPSDYVISAGTEINSSYLLGSYYGVSEVNSSEVLLSSDDIIESNMKLVFTWRNSTSTVVTPPASISNIKVEERLPSSEKEISLFSVASQLSDTEIDIESKTISLSIYDTDLTTLIPNISISSLASISPAIGEVQDFTSPVVYTVTAEDGSTQDWTVSITNVAPSYSVLPFEPDLESGNDGIVFLQQGQANYWVNGQLDGHESSCMYITSNGTDNAYEAISSVSHFIKGVDLTDIYGLTLNFDWKSEPWYQYIQVYLVPDNIVITGGQRIDEEYLIRTLNSSAELTNEEIMISTDKMTTDHMNLVFTWYNTSYNYYSRVPASISNIKLEERLPSSDKEISSFTVARQLSDTEIDIESKTINLSIYDTDLTTLVPNIRISSLASISPAIGEVQDFSSAVTYTVTAEDGSTQDWTVSIANIAPNYSPLPYESNFELNADNFIAFNQGQVNYWMYGHLDAHEGNSMFITNNGIDNTYDIKTSSISHVFKEIDFTDIPAATLSFDWLANGESCCDYLKVYLVPSDLIISAGSLISNDYLLDTYVGVGEIQTVEYDIALSSILSDHMKLVFTWRNDGSVGTMPPASISNIKLEERILSSEKEISLFAVPNQLSVTELDAENRTIDLSFYGSDITNVTPEIIISDFASISPAIGEAQDFTSPVLYTVTAEDGTTSEWTVSITNVMPTYAALPYQSNFDSGKDGFVFIQPAQTNYWMEGNLESHNGNCLYITNDGVDNSYESITSTSHLVKGITFDQVDAAVLSFDWLVGGKYNHQLDVYLVPSNYEITAGTQISYNYLLESFYEGRELNTSEIFLSTDHIIQSNMNLVFTWRNTTSSSVMPPASISNIKIEERVKLTESDVLFFSVDRQTETAEINTEDFTVELEVYNRDLSWIYPEIRVSEFASVSPSNNVAQDFTSPVIYTVTAEDGSVQDWTVSINNIEPDYQTLPINSTFSSGDESFVYMQKGQKSFWTIGDLDAQEGNCLFITNDGINNVSSNSFSISHVFKGINFEQVDKASISFDWFYEDVYNNNSLRVYLVPQDYYLYENNSIQSDYLLATYSGMSGKQSATIDIGAAKVIDSSMLLVFSWLNYSDNGQLSSVSIDNILVEERQSRSDKDIFAVQLENKSTVEIIDSENHSISLTTNEEFVTSLSPEFTISEFASISPSSGSVQDFTNPVNYTVTAEDGSTQVWTVDIAPIESNYATLPFVADFDNGSNGFVFNQNQQNNSWIFGYLNDYDGNCFYISDDGENNNYGIGASVSHLYKEIDFEESRTVKLSFDWLSYGYINDDLLEVSLVPEDYQVIAGTLIPSDYQVGVYLRRNFVSNEQVILRDDLLTEAKMKLVFTWRNNEWSTYQRPASIANVVLEEVSTDSEIISFVLEEQDTEAVINVNSNSIAIQVVEGTNLSKLVPSIEISEGASINYLEGAVVDFTNIVEFIVTAEDGTTTVWSIEVKIVDTAVDVINAGSLKVYPNPLTKFVNVEFSMDITTDVTIEVIDMSGAILWYNEQELVSRFTQNIDMSKFANGLYIIRITAAEQVLMHKITKR